MTRSPLVSEAMHDVAGITRRRPMRPLIGAVMRE